MRLRRCVAHPGRPSIIGGVGGVVRPWEICQGGLPSTFPTLICDSWPSLAFAGIPRPLSRTVPSLVWHAGLAPTIRWLLPPSAVFSVGRFVVPRSLPPFAAATNVNPRTRLSDVTDIPHFLCCIYPCAGPAPLGIVVAWRSESPERPSCASVEATLRIGSALE